MTSTQSIKGLDLSVSLHVASEKAGGLTPSGMAPALTSGSIALNTSAMYAGQAVGATSGGWLIAHGQMSNLHWAGLAGLMLAMAVSMFATRIQLR